MLQSIKYKAIYLLLLCSLTTNLINRDRVLKNDKFGRLIKSLKCAQALRKMIPLWVALRQQRNFRAKPDRGNRIHWIVGNAEQRSLVKLGVGKRFREHFSAFPSFRHVKKRGLKLPENLDLRELPALLAACLAPKIRWHRVRPCIT